LHGQAEVHQVLNGDPRFRFVRFPFVRLQFRRQVNYVFLQAVQSQSFEKVQHGIQPLLRREDLFGRFFDFRFGKQRLDIRSNDCELLVDHRHFPVDPPNDNRHAFEFPELGESVVDRVGD
jgi:hypothetical protein